MQNKKKKNKKTRYKKTIIIHNYILTGLLISLAVIIALIGIREYRFYRLNKEAKSVLSAFNSLKNIDGIDNSYNNEVKLGDYKVIGTIRIDSIALEYPILEKTTDESMLLSVTKLYGPALNEYGNVSIAGHNAHNGSLFSKLSDLKIDDTIEITDLSKETIKYKIYKIYSVNPDDLEPVKTNDKNTREVTLISCIMSAKKRIIVKAKEV